MLSQTNDLDRFYQCVMMGKSIILVGPSDSGKTYFVLSTLIPFLEKKGIKVFYYSLGDEYTRITGDYDLIIFDEVEILQDKDYLQKLHPEDTPYYREEYLHKVLDWYSKLKQIKTTCLYIVTRNEEAEIINFLHSVKNTDWDNREVEVVLFKNKKIEDYQI